MDASRILFVCRFASCKIVNSTELVLVFVWKATIAADVWLLRLPYAYRNQRPSVKIIQNQNIFVFECYNCMFDYCDILSFVRFLCGFGN